MVEEEEGEFHHALRNVVAETLGSDRLLSRLPDVEEDGDIMDFVDEVLFDDQKIYYITVKSVLTRNDVAQAYLAKNLTDRQDTDGPPVEFILMAKKISGRVREIADQVGIIVIQLNWDFPIPARKSPSKNRISKLSHHRSWSVVTRLIWSGPCSIRQLSKTEGVSYSWTHATVTRLIDMGVAEKTTMGVKVVDLDRLMDGIAWERPFNRLLLDEIPVIGTDYMEAAQDIGNVLTEWNVRYAFTAFTAGGLYTGHSQRFDSLYLYLDRKALMNIRESLVSEQGTLTLYVYSSDRDVYRDVEEMDHIKLASRSTTLLDLIGLGYRARTIAREMVNRYAETAYQG